MSDFPLTGRYVTFLQESAVFLSSGLAARQNLCALCPAHEKAQKAGSRDGYLHVTLRHSDTDLIHVGFQEVLEFIECQEGGEYSAANARLAAQIQLIYESEQLTLKNVF